MHMAVQKFFLQQNLILPHLYRSYIITHERAPFTNKNIWCVWVFMVPKIFENLSQAKH